MLVLAGTVPFKGLPLKQGVARFDDDFAIGDNFALPAAELMHCTTAMIATATIACRALGTDPPYAVIAGCLGEGDGSKLVYRFLAEQAEALQPKVLTLHYILPIRLAAEKFIESLRHWKNKPILIADAGGMYVMKPAGFAGDFDLMTPDPGEMAFLADPDAIHPAYVRHFISEVDLTAIPRLIKEAYEHHNAPRVLLVKGNTDYIVRDGEIVATVSEPDIPAMECIGGTGDTITGLVSALAYAGYDLVEAALYASRINRIAGLLTNPTPATRIAEIIRHIPAAIEQVLKGVEYVAA